MRVFLKYIGILFFSLLSLLFLLDLLYTAAYSLGTPRTKIQYILQLKPQHYDIVFFGSSRTESNIDCEIIEKLTGKSCINFGIAGSSIGDAHLVMKLLQHQKITYDTAFLQVGEDYNNIGNSDFMISTLMPFKSNPVIKEEIKKLPKGKWFTYVPFYRYMAFDKVIGVRELVASIAGRETTIDFQNGFWGQTFRKPLVARKFPEKLSSYNPELQEIQELTNNQEATLFLFTAPYCKLAETEPFMDSLERRIPNLKNYIPIFDDQQNYFSDCGHLNIEGAKAFSKILVQDFLPQKQMKSQKE